MRLLLATLCGFILGLLLQKISQPPKTLENQAFETLSNLIQEQTTHQVLQVDTALPGHIVTIRLIKKVALKAIQHFNHEHFDKTSIRRINEFSRLFEDYLRQKIDQDPDFSCTIPHNQDGKPSRHGYPDLLIEHLPTQTKSYLDPKLFESSSRNSSFRSFYYSPHSKTQKVHHHALHLLLGFEHDGENGNWTFLNFHLLDLSKLHLKLKKEYSASNKELYKLSEL